MDVTACAIAWGVCAALLFAAEPPPVGPYQPDEHTLLLYHFDADAPLRDASGASHDGQLTGKAVTAEGMFATGLKFARNTVVRVPDPEGRLRGMKQLTAEVWFRTTSPVARRQRVIKYWNHYLITLWENGGIRVHVYGPNGTVVKYNARTSVQPNVWYHVALTSDGRRTSVYVNGRREGTYKSVAQISNAADSGLELGSAGDDGFEGVLDEVRISDIARKEFLAARMNRWLELTTDTVLSPGFVRALVSPVVEADVDEVEATVQIGQAKEAQGTAPQEAFKPLADKRFKECNFSVLANVPQSLSGRQSVRCRVALRRGEQVVRTSETTWPVQVRPRQPIPKNEFRGTWTHPERMSDPEDYFRRLAGGGFNAAVMRIMRGPTAVYDSRVMPDVRHPLDDKDHLRKCVAAAHRNGIKLHVYVNCFPIFKDPPELAERFRRQGRTCVTADGKPTEWLCPSVPENVELVKRGMTELVREFDVDGIQYDFIRYANSSVCYCPHCRQGFEAEAGVKVENFPADVIEGGKYREAFLKYRAGRVTAAVEEISAAIRAIKPDVVISAAVFSGPEEDVYRSVGQDWPTWVERGYLDALMPMAYQYDLGVYEQTVERIVKRVHGRIPVYAGIGLRSSSGVIRYPEELDLKIDATRRLGAAGFCTFCITPPTDIPEKILAPLSNLALP